MAEILTNCSSCEGSKYCISKPNKNDYKFPEEENKYLMDLECGIWNCHTAVAKLLKENAELKKKLEVREKFARARDTFEIERLKAQIEKMKCFKEEIINSIKSDNSDIEWVKAHNGVAKYIYVQTVIDIIYDKWEMVE